MMSPGGYLELLVAVGESRGGSLVDRRSLQRRKAAVDRLADQIVDEGVARSVRDGAHQPGPLRMRDGIEDRRHVGIRECGERHGRELTPEYGGDRDQRPCRRVKRGDLAEHDATNTGGNDVAFAMSCSLRDSPNVERVPTAGVAYPVEQQHAGLFAQRHAQQLPDLLIGERRDLHTRRESRQLAKVGTTRLVG
jgi:hypothetical protein